MSKLRVASFGVSLDGYGAGPDQSLERPLGRGAEALFQWFFATRTFRSMHGQSPEGSTDVDDQFAARGFENVGAWILGRNMFGPIRGSWGDHSWRGWWDNDPPYHVPVFVLTHHPRDSLIMEGGTVFHFVTEGIDAALARATEAANGRDIRIGGGPATIRQYLARGLIDELHLAMAPTLLGTGEALFAGLDLPALGYQCIEQVAGAGATHARIVRGTAASHHG